MQAEIARLRQENETLRAESSASAERLVHAGPNPYLLPSTPLMEALREKRDELQVNNDQIESVLESYQNLQRSLDALIPALEIQIEGWGREIHQLHQTIAETETTCAEVVSHLEAKLHQTQEDLLQKDRQVESQASIMYMMRADSTRLEEEIHKLGVQLRQKEQEIQLLTAQLPALEVISTTENPYTNLSILGD
ncbi:hypothetical protein [Pontibacter sp. G13]|uniref:hypothetical protein n=1 Tax=Pontibacter sp. G13 TaxID=3074898 RepID=UPI00288C1F0D|nr:hypothetical protein [Pontibacter sp. G13]WNJ16319.1 hypothetical protein RJD25_15755 [Pontibacter sp. G13]